MTRAGLGQMAETINRDPFYQDRPGYEGMLNEVSRNTHREAIQSCSAANAVASCCPPRDSE
jgi:hypothetical protein